MTIATTTNSDGGSERSIAGFCELQRTGSQDLREQLVEEHKWIAVHCARRFSHRGESMDDLIQVAMLGLVLAVDRFNPERGVQFSTFAVPTILGELRRHFRDRTWPVRVTRRVKELHLALSAVTEQLSHELGRPPHVEDVAAALDVGVDEVLEALEAGACYRTSSLDGPNRQADDDSASRDGEVRLAVLDKQLATADVRATVQEAVRDLPERDRKVIYLRFYEELSQSAIAEQVGVSQVHVSRIIRSALSRLHDRLDTDGELYEELAAS